MSLFLEFCKILFQEILRLIIKNAEKTFIEVTVFVGAVLMLFGYINLKLSGKLVKNGDILFPLIAMDKRSAIWATVFNTIPALIVGLVAYFFEVSLF